MLASDLKNSTVYTDFQGLSELRREATANGTQALEKTARQFEALFVQMMLKSMREAGQGEGLFDNDQSNLYRDMYDKQLSLHLTEHGEGMGLARMMVQQLKGSLQSAQSGVAGEVEKTYQPPARGRSSFELKTGAVSSKTHAAVEATRAPVLGFDTPEQFVTALAPHAQRAAARLGVDPKALLAQAALETGWGKAVIRHMDGSSSHNLFNIKADSRWDGERVAKQTVEYRQGVAARELAQFRSYGSLAESFDDYTNFLATSPRYAAALEQGRNGARYVEALQEAGYATDPAYATKIKRIMQGETMANAMVALKNVESGTLSNG